MIRYLVDSYAYAEKKLKWISSRHNLSAVAVPKPAPDTALYTLDEVQRLIPELYKVNQTGGWIAQVGAFTGRRLTPIRSLTKDSVTHHDSYTTIRFPRETDKAGNDSTATVKGRAYHGGRGFMRPTPMGFPEEIFSRVLPR